MHAHNIYIYIYKYTHNCMAAYIQSIHPYIHACVRACIYTYIELHEYFTLHYSTTQCNMIHYITFQYNMRHDMTLPILSARIALHDITLHTHTYINIPTCIHARMHACLQAYALLLWVLLRSAMTRYMR